MASDDEIARVFTEAVRNYIALHDQIIDATKDLRAVKKKKAELADTILEYMHSNDIDYCQVKDGKLMRRESKRTEALKKDHVVGELKGIMPESSANELFDRILSKREVKTGHALKRTRTKTESKNSLSVA